MKTTLMIIALLLLAGSVLAVPVDPNAANGIAAHELHEGGGVYVLDVNGTQWVKGAGTSEEWISFSSSLPVPIEEIENWTLNVFETFDGVIWQMDIGDPTRTTWRIVTWPAVVVSTKSQSMGDVKSMFR